MAKRLNGEGSIYQDGDKWVAALKIGVGPTGKPIVKRRKSATKTAAIAALRELHAGLSAGRLVTLERTSLGAFLDHWLEHQVKPSREPSTYRQYEWITRLHIKPTLGRRPLAAVTRKDIQALLSQKSKQTVAARGALARPRFKPTLSFNTIRNIRATLHAAFEEARKDGLLAVNPAELVAVPKKERRQAPSWLTPEQACRLIAAAEHQEMGELILYMLHTGTRIGEATGLRWQDVCLSDTPTVTIQGQLQRIKGKGLQWKQGTKTNQIRTLALTETAANMLRNVKAKQVLEGVSHQEGIVFLTITGAPIDPKLAGTRLKAYCKLAGVPVVSPHKLRHTAASLMLAATGDLHAVQKTLGHSHVALTANLYGHASPEMLRPALQKLEQMYRS